MPLISLDDDDQRWVPTHVNVTVLRARALRTKGKQGSRYVYTVIQVGKEKYTTGLVEKAEEPQWDEECSLELPPGLLLESGGVGAYPPGSGKLLLTVMHRVLIGLDVFLGQAVVSLDKVFQEGACLRNEWLKLHSKAGRKEKERGALQVTVQFTRNNMTASMYDLTVKDKPRSAFGKLKDRVTGKKRTDVESSSAILPGRYAALSGSVGPPFAGDGGADEPLEDQWVEEPKSKVKDFFLKGKMRKNSDTRSCSSLASDSSVASSAGDPIIPIELSRTPVYSSRVMEPFHMENDGGVQVMTHKRAHSDDASKIAVVPLSSSAVENLKGPNIPLSKSTVCINGSHVYSSEPGISKSPSPAPAKRSLLEKCAPLSRSLQNLTRRGEDPQKSSSEKKNGEAEVTQAEARCVKTAGASGVSEVMDKGKRLRRTLFSSGRSDSLPAKPEQSQVSASLEGRRRGWFGSGDSQNKPRPELFPKVACSSDTPLPSNQPPCSLPLHTPDSQSPPSDNPTNPFTISPSPPSISPSNPFLTRLQQNPFFEDLLAEEALRSPTAAHCFRTIHRLPVGADHPIPQCNGVQTQMFLMKRERPKSISRQRSLPTITNESPEKLSRSKHSSSERSAESDDFEAFASSRLKTPSGTPTRPSLASQAQAANLNSCGDDQSVITEDLESSSKLLDLPPLPPRRPLRSQTSKERCLDSWLDRAQELAVLKEASFLSQSDFASLKHVRQEANRNSQIEANLLCSKKERDPDSTGDVSEATVVNKNLGEDARGRSPCSEGECSAPETLCFPSDWETTVTESLCSSPQTKSKEDPQCETECTLKHADVGLLDFPRRDSNNNTDSSEIAFIDSGSSASELVETNRACVEDSREGPEGVRNTSEIQMFSPNTDRAIVETSPVQNPVTCSSAFERSCDRQEHHHTSPESDVLLNKDLTVMTKSGCLSRVDSSVLQMTHNAKQIANACQEPKHSTIQKTLNESFEDLHASMAPRNPAVRSARTRPRSTTSSPKTLSDAEPNRPSSEPILQNFSASCLAATSNCVLPGLSSALIPPIETPGVGSSTVPPHVDAALTLSPETSQPLHDESSPHPVKPLTLQGEKRAESRSVLEKLKSTINPSRSPPATAADDEQNQMSLMEARAQYQNLSNMELIALLLQQEMDVKKQRAESEVQLALLEKREVELKKMKVQVRDLEDYIDKLLVRIMEQTPTLLQVRGRPK